MLAGDGGCEAYTVIVWGVLLSHGASGRPAGLMVKVRYSEGVANHTDPESCADAREGICEALTGERIGQPPAFAHKR